MNQSSKMLNIDCLIANGDSYSAPIGWPEQLASRLDVTCYNLSVIGSSNDRILRTTIESVEKYISQNLKPYVIIGWSFIQRTEIWYHGPDERIIRRGRQSNLNQSSRLVTADWIPDNELSQQIKEMIASVEAIDKKIIDWYTDIFLLSRYLRAHAINYVFFSAADNKPFPINSWPDFKDLALVRNVNQDPGIYKLHDFCIPDYARKYDKDCKEPTGHLSAEGHKKFSDFMFDLINDIQSH